MGITGFMFIHGFWVYLYFDSKYNVLYFLKIIIVDFELYSYYVFIIGNLLDVFLSAQTIMMKCFWINDRMLPTNIHRWWNQFNTGN